MTNLNVTSAHRTMDGTAKIDVYVF